MCCHAQMYLEHAAALPRSQAASSNACCSISSSNLITGAFDLIRHACMSMIHQQRRDILYFIHELSH